MRDSLSVLLQVTQSVTWETSCRFCYMNDTLSALLYEKYTTFCYMGNSVTCRSHCIFVTWEAHPLLYYMKDKLFCYLRDSFCFVTWETHFLFYYMRDSLLLHETLCSVTWVTHYLFWMCERYTVCFVTWRSHMRVSLFCYMRDTLSALLHKTLALIVVAWDSKWFVYFSFNVSILNLFIETEETCSDEMFDCNGDKKKCIHRDLVCNYINDCGNWNDEASELCNGKCVLKYVI